MSGGMYPLPGVPLLFSPLGTYDGVDGTLLPPGACEVLTNLVHDITTPNVWVPRPGVVALTGGFAGFLQPGIVSAALAIGRRIYGMIATALTPGYDQPFCFDLDTATFIAVTGMTALNVPASPPSTGTWTPPMMAVIGAKIVITHTGYSGTGTNFFGVIDITNLATPVYSSSNTATNALPSVPTNVIQFSNRAWYVIGNALYFSKSLDPLTIVLATDILTLGDSKTAIVTLSQQTIMQTTGGVIQALLAFKTDIGFWQITGDSAASTLALQGPNSSIGCAAARSAVVTPAGVFVMATDGVHIVRLDGVMSEKSIPGVRSPFSDVSVPSRACAAFTDTVFRICLTWNSPQLGTVKQDYWYDFEINQWGGPHTFTYDLALPVGHVFILASNDFPAELYSSEPDPRSSSVYSEIQAVGSPGSAIWGAFTWGAGVWGGATFSVQPLTYEMLSSVLPQRDMQVQAVVEATIDIGFTPGVSGNVTVQVLDPANAVLGLAIISAPSSGTIWGAFTWGSAPWAGAATGFNTYNLDWTAPVVYKRAAVSVTGTSFQGLRIGATRMRVEAQGYMNLQNPP